MLNSMTVGRFSLFCSELGDSEGATLAIAVFVWSCRLFRSVALALSNKEIQSQASRRSSHGKGDPATCKQCPLPAGTRTLKQPPKKHCTSSKGRDIVNMSILFASRLRQPHPLYSFPLPTVANKTAAVSCNCWIN